jgi:pimeloyl-ACP methyl ester carboxylesterase
MKDVILIHGAWAGSWVWDPLLEGLRAAGYRPHALDLPGNGNDLTRMEDVCLETYRDHVLAYLDQLDAPAHLVGHSGGGVTVTAVAEAAPQQVASVAYVAGMMLPSGMGFADLCARLAADGADVAGIGPYLEQGDGYSWVPPSAARDIFLHDVADEPAWRAAERLVPQPDGGRDIRASWSARHYGSLPRLYVEALADRSVVLAAQRRMQQLVPGARVVSLDCGHVPQLAAPGELLDALISFFTRTDAFLAYPNATSASHQEPRP